MIRIGLFQKQLGWRLVFALAIYLVPHFSYAQEKLTITGKVTDAETKDPIPGASVLEAGTLNGTITGLDGRYVIHVNKNAQLEVSFVGMESQLMDIGSATVHDFQLSPDMIGLEEVVVTGYNAQRKADLTGAVEVVEMKSIESVSLSSGNPMQALQGRVPGLYIEKTGTPNAANSRILIRGANTLGDNNPLYIIDGIPTKRPEVFQNLNVGSVESVQVLKDASASSIYGSRASNGVVIVTTKNGRRKLGAVNIEFNTNFSVQSEKRQRFDMLNAVDRGRALWQASVNDGVDPASGYGEIYEFDWNGDYSSPVLNGISVQPYVGGNTDVPAGDTDWQDETYQPGYVTNNNLTISGGNENTSVLLSLGYLKNTGMLAYTNYDRFTARLNAHTSMFDQRFKAGMNAQVVSSNERLETPDLGSVPTPTLAITLAPTIPLYTASGDYAGPLGSGYSDRNNPVHMQAINRWDNTRRTYLFGNVFAELEILKNLFVKTNVGLDYSLVKDKDIELSFTEGFIARDVNSLTLYNSEFNNLTWSNTIRYTLNASDHNLSFLAGIEAVSEKFSDNTGYKEGFSVQNEDFFVLSAGTSNGNSFGSATQSYLFSQFGKVSYNYANRYLASATIRRDGSSRFGKDNRYGVFPALTAGWRISRESFMSRFEWLSDLKIRAGWGKVGNQDIGDFAHLGLFETRYGATASQVDGMGHVDFFDQYWNVGTAYDLDGNGTGNLPSGFVSVQAANNNLKWESTTELNLGVDFALFDRRILGAFDYYTRETDGILIRPPVASAVGEGQLRWLNGATKENKGWELALSYFSAENKDFTYSVTATASQSKDKITALPEEVRTGYPGNAEKTILGHSEFEVFGYKTDGIFRNQAEVDAHADQVGAAPGRIRYKDLNKDGLINALDQDFIGTTLPKLEYSLSINLAYKNFDLSIFGSGVAGKTGYDPYTYLNDFIRGRDNVGPGVFEAWTPQNPNASKPALTLSDGNNETRTSDYFFVNASYFKLRNLQLGYALPASLIERLRLDRLRIYVMAENLFWIKSKDFQGPDPERTDMSTIPVPTIYSFGISLHL